MSIVDRLQSIVKERGTTFKQLERDVGLGNGTIRRWEEQSPRLDKLTKVADYLHVSLDFLVYGRSVSEPAASSKLELDLRAEKERGGLHATAFLCPRMRWISSLCIGSFRPPTARSFLTWPTSNTSASSNRKKNLFIQHTSTGATTVKAAPPRAVKPATEPPDFFALL